MGTEVGMLIQRLRSVLGVKEDKFQFIMTGASLGNDEEKKQVFIDLLTGQSISEDEIAMPEGITVEMHETISSHDPPSQSLVQALSDYPTDTVQSSKPSTLVLFNH